MINEEELEPKQRIFDTAVRLFARYGYSSVGIRLIAKEAAVNVAMISYYFGGKSNLFSTIIESFFAVYRPIVIRYTESGLPFEERIRAFVHEVTAFVMDNPELCKLVMIEISIENPRLDEIRSAKVRALRPFLTRSIINAGKIDACPARRMEIVGPAILGMVFSRFLFGPMDGESGKAAVKIPRKEYEETITALLIKGVPQVCSGAKL